MVGRGRIIEESRWKEMRRRSGRWGEGVRNGETREEVDGVRRQGRGQSENREVGERMDVKSDGR